MFKREITVVRGTIMVIINTATTIYLRRTARGPPCGRAFNSSWLEIPIPITDDQFSGTNSDSDPFPWIVCCIESQILQSFDRASHWEKFTDLSTLLVPVLPLTEHHTGNNSLQLNLFISLLSLCSLDSLSLLSKLWRRLICVTRFHPLFSFLSLEWRLKFNSSFLSFPVRKT